MDSARTTDVQQAVVQAWENQFGQRSPALRSALTGWWAWVVDHDPKVSERNNLPEGVVPVEDFRMVSLRSIWRPFSKTDWRHTATLPDHPARQAMALCYHGVDLKRRDKSLFVGQASRYFDLSVKPRPSEEVRKLSPGLPEDVEIILAGLYLDQALQMAASGGLNMVEPISISLDGLGGVLTAIESGQAIWPDIRCEIPNNLPYARPRNNDQPVSSLLSSFLKLGLRVPETDTPEPYFCRAAHEGLATVSEILREEVQDGKVSYSLLTIVLTDEAGKQEQYDFSEKLYRIKPWIRVGVKVPGGSAIVSPITQFSVSGIDNAAARLGESSIDWLVNCLLAGTDLYHEDRVFRNTMYLPFEDAAYKERRIIDYRHLLMEGIPVIQVGLAQPQVALYYQQGPDYFDLTLSDVGRNFMSQESIKSPNSQRHFRGYSRK